MPEADENLPVEAETSLDQLSQAFAKAMGRQQPIDEADDNADESDSARCESEASAALAAVEDEEDKSPTDTCPVTPQSILESILFVGHPENEPITSRAVADLLRGVEPSEVDELVKVLNEEYVDCQYPFHIESVGAGYRLQLNEEFDFVRQRFYGRIREARLSRAAVDVLAIVAYNQPVTRQEVDELVGSSSGRLLNQLVRRQLIVRQTTEAKPRQKQYVTTDRFLDLFGLGSLGDLPRSDEPT